MRAEAQVRDQISPPVALVLPGQPFVVYGQTMMDGAVAVNLTVLILVSDAAPVDKVQRALDDLLGIGPGEGHSIAGAVAADPTLGGTVEWCMPTAVTTYGRVEYGGVSFFGARLGLQVGAV